MNGDGDGAYSSAKLREFVLGRVKQNEDLHQHTGLVDPEGRAGELLSFFESLDLGREYGKPTNELTASRMVRRTAATRHVGASVSDVPAYAVGMTDQSVEISESQALVMIATAILNEMAPYIGLIFGAPNKGKTGFAALWAELWRELTALKYDAEEGVVVSNVDAPFVDKRITDFEEWQRNLFGDQTFVKSNGEAGEPPLIDSGKPVWWHFDEASTHLDARTKSTEVSEQYLPMVKRFAKVNVDAVHIGHSTLDVYKDLRRNNIATEVVVKTGLKEAEVFEHATDTPTDLKYVLEGIPETSYDYNPNDYSPWEW